MNEIQGWLVGRLPGGWFEGEPEVTVDREEVIVIGRLSAPTAEGEETVQRAAERGRISRFREETRRERMQIADETELRFGRKVAWGAACGESRQVFTSLSVPVMTRLRQPERRVLDTLVDAGIARSRSEALAWCVRLAGQHQDEWIEQLRAALVAVHEVREAGPAA